MDKPGVNVLHLARDSRRFRSRVTIDGLAVIRFPKNTTIINIIIIIIESRIQIKMFLELCCTSALQLCRHQISLL